MKVAIMQPYVFPYIGYFQLINTVDKFVFYDDVNYIKNGWIDRNKILVNNNEFLFKIPLSNSSSFKKINQTNINDNLYEIWVDKFLKTVEQSYKKAPYFNIVFPIIVEILNSKSKSIAELAKTSIHYIIQYLEIKTKIINSSEIYYNSNMNRTERLIDICKKENATEYINTIGGFELYNPIDFNNHNIKLKFVNPNIIDYKQFGSNFIPYLSIIDIIMFNDKSTINNSLLNIN